MNSQSPSVLGNSSSWRLTPEFSRSQEAAGVAREFPLVPLPFPNAVRAVHVCMEAPGPPPRGAQLCSHCFRGFSRKKGGLMSGGQKPVSWEGLMAGLKGTWVRKRIPGAIIFPHCARTHLLRKQSSEQLQALGSYKHVSEWERGNGR